MSRTQLTIAMLFVTLLPAGAARADLTGPVTGFEAITYQPRSQPPPGYHDYPRAPEPTGASTQIHAGFFSPDKFSSTGLVLGFRAGGGPDEHIQLGVNVDWHYKSENQTAIVSEQPLPGGGSAQVERVLSSATSNLVPVLGYLQVGGARSLPIIPYVGVGAGYEFYFLSASDFNTGSHFDAQYGGFAWQAWGGVQLRLSGRSRLAAEVFTNQADLGRNVDYVGQSYREKVNLDGAGMRFGVNWGF